MSATKSQRILLIVNNLVAHGDPKWKPLYSFLEESGIAVGNAVLGGSYKQVSTLKGTAATRTAFLNRLKTLATTAGVKAVDLFLQLHGAPGKVWFHGGEVSTAQLRQDIVALGLPNRLRLVYNTSCYGDSHSADLIGAGFRTAIGSKKVNANAGVEYPTFCSLWAAGSTAQSAISTADAPLSRAAQDAAAKQLGFADADSQKVVRGLKSLKISS